MKLMFFEFSNPFRYTIYMTWSIILMVGMLCLASSFIVNLFVFYIGFVRFSLKVLLWSFVTFHDYIICRWNDILQCIYKLNTFNSIITPICILQYCCHTFSVWLIGLLFFNYWNFISSLRFLNSLLNFSSWGWAHG